MKQLACAECGAPLFDLKHGTCERCRLRLRIQIYALRARLICELKDEAAAAAVAQRAP